MAWLTKPIGAVAVSRNGQVSGCLIHTTLKESCDEVIDHFTALSYAWGDASDTTIIAIDGKPLSVARTLDSALRHLRDSKRVMRIWADAICINQKDNLERAAQVQQMGSIYRAAHHTVIFLGEANMKSNWVFKWIDRPATLSDTKHEILRQTIDHFLMRQWLYRVWVFQELILSSDPRAQGGNRRCSWGAFFKIFEAYHDMKLVFTFTDTKPIPTLPDFTSTSSVAKSRANFRGVIDQMQLARSRYLTKYYQTKFDLSQDASPYPSGGGIQRGPLKICRYHCF